MKTRLLELLSAGSKIKMGNVLMTILAFLTVSIHGQTHITTNTINPGLYEKFEITIDIEDPYFSLAQKNLINSKNPYDKDEIVLEVVFTDPNGNTFSSNGFLYETLDESSAPQNISSPCGPKRFPYIPQQILKEAIGGQEFSWRARFAPQTLGNWTYSIVFKFPSTTTYIPDISVGSGNFICLASNSKGFINITNNVFEYSDQSGFIPIGMNIPSWPSYTCENQGSNLYDVVFDRLAANGANFCRIFIDNNRALNLNGVKNSLDKGIYQRAYYDYFRQIGSFQLDKIIEKAEEKGIHLQLCLKYNTLRLDNWPNNAYNVNSSIGNASQRGNCTNIEELLDKSEAIEVQKNLIKYIVDRWGYSTSIFSFDMANEADLAVHRIAEANPNGQNLYDAMVRVGDKMISWHTSLISALRTHDQYNHPITSSFAQYKLSYSSTGNTTPPSWDRNVNGFKNNIASQLDYYDFHFYPYPDKHGDLTISHWPMLDEKPEMINRLSKVRDSLPEKQIIIGEHGLNYMGNLLPSLKGSDFYPTFDPGALSHHSSLWSSLLSGFMGPVSVWDYYHFFDRQDPTTPSSNFMKQFKPVSEFAKQIGKFDYSFQKAFHTKDIFLSNYYVSDKKRNKLFGWVQNNKFSFNELIGSYKRGTDGNNDGTFDNPHIYLTSELVTGKPIWNTSLNYRTIQLTVPVSGTYAVSWYDPETGLSTIEETYESCNDMLTIIIPSSQLNSKFGDIAYIASHTGYGENIADGSNIISPEVNSDVNLHGNSTNGVFYVDQSSQTFAKSSKVSGDWIQEITNISVPPIYANTSFYVADDAFQSIFYCGVDNNIKNFYRVYKLNNSSNWQLKKLTNQNNLSIDPNSNIEKIGNTIFYVRNDNKIGAMYACGQPYNCAGKLSGNSPEIVDFSSIDVSIGSPATVYFSGRNANGVKNIYKSYYSGGWQMSQLTMSSNPSANLNIRPNSKVKFKDQNLAFLIRHDGIISAIYNCNQPYMCNSTTNSSAVKVKLGTDLVVTKTQQVNVYYIGEDDNIYKQYWANGQWQSDLISTDQCFNGVKDNTSLLYFNNEVFFIDKIDGKVHVLSQTDPNVILRQKSPKYFNNYTDDFSEQNFNTVDEDEIVLYPNPTNGRVKFSGVASDIRIYDIRGQFMLRVNKTNELDLSNYTKGVYLIKYRNQQDVEFIKRLILN